MCSKSKQLSSKLTATIVRLVVHSQFALELNYPEARKARNPQN